MNKEFTDFYEAWWYLTEHPMYKDKRIPIEGMDSTFSQSLDIMVVKVNPENNTIEDDDNLNTKTQVWLETGKVYYEDDGSLRHYHDTKLDSGGNTFEEAIIELANNVAKTKNIININLDKKTLIKLKKLSYEFNLTIDETVEKILKKYIKNFHEAWWYKKN
jgi:hypothetical protein